MLVKHRNALGSRSLGIGLLVGETIIWLCFAWSFLRVMHASPGYVRDLFPSTEAPLESVSMESFSYASQPVETPLHDVLQRPIAHNDVSSVLNMRSFTPPEDRPETAPASPHNTECTRPISYEPNDSAKLSAEPAQHESPRPVVHIPKAPKPERIPFEAPIYAPSELYCTRLVGFPAIGLLFDHNFHELRYATESTEARSREAELKSMLGIHGENYTEARFVETPPAMVSGAHAKSGRL
ncbi:hypothetical protein MVES1_000105 [Malassezia vespertilionis]|uniref:uncharacterized protein n=1 Tax=Malassezia vespertilionis TaxID=2020962 RepID=UPI0024B03E91|nr:uncharacterized protein MVES1_000105 [Malassezia vespertilionis]WFD04781.1 hypothetical protein MVES1_000105 [Malassezia vespertilionis]